ncbi:unnamed protein product [Spirodela intermedia]|uniref:Uncharacterized protein n=1 Tax=Spirodela intermedia TaxID=51605 RepID=A0A7I8JCH3_SPIIN|nr:unnamed protein product [Spirodela intermedia]CAA6667691.1 unnamed protein product [Spirodela intermedia]
MLGRMPLSPLSTAESVICRPYYTLNTPNSLPNLATSRRPHARGECSVFGREVTASGKWRLHSADKTYPPLSSRTEEKTKAWEECRRLVSSFDFTVEEADAMLGKAFGWVHSPYWGEERERQVPSHEVVGETLTYLRDLGLSDDDLRKLLKKFPEVLGCGLDEEVKVNVLGYNVDCKGDCIAQCTRCWARF